MSRDKVVEAARTLAERGLSELTMTALANALDVTPMSLYTYVSDKEHLVDLVFDSVLAEVEVPGPEVGPWDVRLRRLHDDVCRALLRHPGLLMRHGPREDDTHGDRLLDGYLQILLDGGFDEEVAAEAYTGLYYLAMGAVVAAINLDVSSPAMAERRSPRDATRRVQPRAAQLSRDDYARFALDTYIAGLKTLAPQRPKRRPARASRP